MRSNLSRRISLLLLPLLVLVGVGCSVSWLNESVVVTPTTSAVADPAVAPAVQAAWGQPPPCRNEPQPLAKWRNDIILKDLNDTTLQQFQAYLNQLRRYTPLFHRLSPDDLADRLAIPDSADAPELRQRALTVLWLNLISGRLNRATEITPPDAAAPLTLLALLDQLEQAENGSADLERLISLAEAVNAGQYLSRPVCARLIYRSGMVVRESLWSAQGFFDKSQTLADMVPPGITSFSPDASRLVIETPRNDTRGGPLYLYNLAGNGLLNLNEQAGLPNYTGVSSLQVSAWHYDNRHLLLVNEDDEVTIWLDLDTGQYTSLTLGLDTTRMTPPRQITLSPDGTGFAFITFGDENHSTNLHWYSITDHTVSLLTTLPVARGHLTALSFSPTSRQVAFVVRQGDRRQERSRELYVMNLQDASSRLLLTGSLGSAQPVWSPDGQQIAFTRKSEDAAANGARAGQSNIWTVSVASGEARQLTFVDSIKQTPVWSPDGQYLAFVTGDGQIGMASLAEPGLVWQVDTELIQPQFTSIALIP